MSKINEAMKSLGGGFNCAQAVCSAFSEDFGLDKSLAARAACALGVGMCRKGNVCGAVSGALMVIGLKYGSAVPEDTKAKVKSYEAGNIFLDSFTKKNKTIICRDLIGMEINTPEKLKAATEKGVFENICKGLVQDAVEILEKTISGTH